MFGKNRIMFIFQRFFSIKLPVVAKCTQAAEKWSCSRLNKHSHHVIPPNMTNLQRFQPSAAPKQQKTPSLSSIIHIYSYIIQLLVPFITSLFICTHPQIPVWVIVPDNPNYSRVRPTWTGPSSVPAVFERFSGSDTWEWFYTWRVSYKSSPNPHFTLLLLPAGRGLCSFHNELKVGGRMPGVSCRLTMRHSEDVGSQCEHKWSWA